MNVIRARALIADAHSEPMRDVAVTHHDGIIAEVSPWRAGLGPAVEVDGVLIPGFVDAHSHLRGLPLDAQGIPARMFESWICSLGAATELDPYDEAIVAACGLLETGVTAVQGFVESSSDETLTLERGTRMGAALSSAGIRALLMLGFADRALLAPEPADGDWAAVPPAREPLSASRLPELARRWLAADTRSRIGRGIGPVGAQWSTEESLGAIASSAGRSRIHTHLHESRLHRDWLQGQPSPLDRLTSAGLLNEDLSCAHAVHLTETELDRIADSGASLVHCPISNEALLVGTAPVAAWLRRGIPSALGIDSHNVGAPDMFEVMRAAVASARRCDDPITTQDVFAMATTGGARAVGNPAGGRVAAGAAADFVQLASGGSIAEIVERGTAADVLQVWVDGELVVENGASIHDPAPSRARLVAQLAADHPRREKRIADQAPLLDLVDRLSKARS